MTCKRLHCAHFPPFSLPLSRARARGSAELRREGSDCAGACDGVGQELPSPLALRTRRLRPLPPRRRHVSRQCLRVPCYASECLSSLGMGLRAPIAGEIAGRKQPPPRTKSPLLASRQWIVLWALSFSGVAAFAVCRLGRWRGTISSPQTNRTPPPHAPSRCKTSPLSLQDACKDGRQVQSGAGMGRAGGNGNDRAAEPAELQGGGDGGRGRIRLRQDRVGWRQWRGGERKRKGGGRGEGNCE